MEITKVELVAVEEVSQQVVAPQVCELSELQLTFVGGGIGDVVFG